MASLSIPFLFPAVRLGNEYYGDGAMRQTNPLSPAINLGADKLLVIGVRQSGLGSAFGKMRIGAAPTAGQIFGYMLDTLFMDQIYADMRAASSGSINSYCTHQCHSPGCGPSMRWCWLQVRTCARSPHGTQRAATTITCAVALDRRPHGDDRILWRVI